jgi:hypothetical protein
VGQGVGKIDWDVVEEISPFDDVDQLHACSDGHEAHSTLGDFHGESAVKVFASRIHRSNRAVEHVPVATWIQIGSTDQDESVEGIQDRVDAIEVVGWRKDHWYPTSLANCIEVSGG